MASIFFPAARRPNIAPKFSLLRRPIFSSPRTWPSFSQLVAVGSTPPRFFSSSEAARVLADENMGRLIQEKINEIRKINDEGLPVPENFPFEMVDKANNGIVILRRDFHGEKIKVKVGYCYPDIDITITKDDGTLLRFSCAGNEKQGLTIHDVEFEPRQAGNWHNEYEEVRDKKLERALLKYLAARGIDSSFVENVYLANKKRQQSYLDWLVKIKDFVVV